MASPHSPFPWRLSPAEVASDPARIRALEEHGLLGCWARRISPDLDRLPADLADRVRSFRRRTLATQALLRARTEPLLEALLARGLPVVILKGMDLVETLFESPSDRPMVDVDVWVPGDDASREAMEAVLAAGWTVDPIYARITPATLHRWAEVNLVSPEGDVAFDLHRLLVQPNRFRLPEPEFAARSLPLVGWLDGLLRLDPRDNVLFLAIHLAGHHGWESLLRNLEVARLFGGFDEATRREVAAAAGRAGCHRALAVALEGARRHLDPEGATLPLDRRGKRWAVQVDRAILRGLAGEAPATRLDELETLLWQPDSLVDVVRYLAWRVRR